MKAEMKNLMKTWIIQPWRIIRNKPVHPPKEMSMQMKISF